MSARSPGAAQAMREALRSAPARWSGVFAGLLYLLLYLLAIQNVVVSFGTENSRFVSVPSIAVVPNWREMIFKPIAPFYFEPVAAFYPSEHVTLLLSPLNLLMGTALALLFALNIAAAFHVVRSARACRTRAYSGLLGAIPGFLTGFACCVPTVALLFGAQFTVALVAVRAYFFPLAVAALAGSLLWNLRRRLELTPLSVTR